MSTKVPFTITWNSVLPICDQKGSVIGTGVAVGRHRVLTALHVIDGQSTLSVTGSGAVTDVVCLPARRFGATRKLARRSYERTRSLTRQDDGTVDLALLAVPGLAAPALLVRRSPLERDEYVTVLGFGGGFPAIGYGPITWTDGADFVAHMLLEPGNSGAPAIDAEGRLAGLITMCHPSAGAIGIDSPLLGEFLGRAPQLLGA